MHTLARHGGFYECNNSHTNDNSIIQSFIPPRTIEYCHYNVKSVYIFLVNTSQPAEVFLVAETVGLAMLLCRPGT